jgi:hypothetical protein
MGLYSLQLFVLFGLSFVFLAISPWLLIVAVAIIYLLVKKISKENRKGNPDYINAFFISLSSQKNLLDKESLFQKLRNNEPVL